MILPEAMSRFPDIVVARKRLVQCGHIMQSALYFAFSACPEGHTLLLYLDFKQLFESRIKIKIYFFNSSLY